MGSGTFRAMAERAFVHECPRCRAARGDAQRFCASCAYDFWGAAAGRAQGDRVESRHTSLMAGASNSRVTPTRGSSGWPGPVVSVMAGGALAILGSVMPWISTASASGGIAYSGVDGGGDGWVTVIAGVGLIGLAIVGRRGA